MNKKIALGLLAVALLAAGCSKKPNNTNKESPPPAGLQAGQADTIAPELNAGLSTDESGAFANWRPYGSALGNYSIKLPGDWYIEPTSLDSTAGVNIFFSNNDQMDIKKSGVVAVELIAGKTKLASEDMEAIAKKGLKKGASVGQVEKAVTNSGLQMVRVDHVDGKVTGPPGYFIETSPTTFLAVLPSSGIEDGTVRQIVSTIGVLNK